MAAAVPPSGSPFGTQPRPFLQSPHQRQTPCVRAAHAPPGAASRPTFRSRYSASSLSILPVERSRGSRSPVTRTLSLSLRAVLLGPTSRCQRSPRVPRSHGKLHTSVLRTERSGARAGGRPAPAGRLGPTSAGSCFALVRSAWSDGGFRTEDRAPLPYQDNTTPYQPPQTASGAVSSDSMAAPAPTPSSRCKPRHCSARRAKWSRPRAAQRCSAVPRSPPRQRS